MESSRRRSRLGSQWRAACPVRATVCIQATRSPARGTMAHQIWFWVKSCSGRVGRARSFAPRVGAQAAVLRAADALLGAGPAAVPQLQVGQLPAGRVGDERGEPVPVVVG